MRVVVVGASGNLGTALLRRLVNDNAVTIDAVSRRVPEPDAAQPYAGVRRWHAIDVGAADAIGALTVAFADADAVINFAWGFQPTRRPDLLRRTGVDGSAHVLAAAAAAGVTHLIHTSSVGAYAPRRDLNPVGESYPVTGVPGSVYSAHKVEAERHLDAWERDNPNRMLISRLRPGFVLQRAAGSALFRYGLPGWLPASVLRIVPLLPLHRSFVIPVVAADDVADAVARLITRPVGGAFNLAADAVLTRDEVADILGARPVELPPKALEALVQVSWRLQLQPLDAGWIRLAYAVPMLDNARSKAELGWNPRTTAKDAMREAIAGMQHSAGSDSPVLRRRSVMDGVARLLRHGPISRRREP